MTKIRRAPLWVIIGCLLIQFSVNSEASANNSSPSDTAAPTTSFAPETTTTLAPPPLKASDIVKISKIQTKDPVVFITIDDGATVSKELARLLDKQQVPVTTFAMPEMIWRARKWYRARENMTFENHTNSHAHMTTISPRQQRNELCVANKLIKQIIGERPVMYRPPRGSWKEENRVAMAKCGLKYAVLWNVVIEKDVPKNIRFSKGDIILFHYIPSLPDALKTVLKKLKEQGLKPVLLRDYLK
jgi:peptidoglycan/xylan/chitin deacetylase (PgdA/CDA1 family)